MSFEAIYRRHHQALYRYCLAILGNPEDAQDALQNTMVKAMRALQDEKRQIKLKPWLYRIAHNESIDLLRKRRPTEEIDVDLAASGPGAAETAATREQLRRLIADLDELPDRQRGALVMRELSGLSFEQIAGALATSAAVARQTVYEARLGLRQMSEGREMPCDEVCRVLSDADGRVARRRDIRAHLRACPACREFRDGIAERKRDFAALSPLPAVAAAALLRGLLDSGAAATSAGTGIGLGGSLGAGASKVAATSALAKVAVTAAVVAGVGIGVAEQRGLIDTPLSDGDEQSVPSSPGISGSEAGHGSGVGTADGHGNEGKRGDKSESATPRASLPDDVTGPAATNAAGAGGGHRHGPPEGLPAASSHGQQTAAAHRSTGRGRSGGRSSGQGRSGGRQKASSAPHSNAKAGGFEAPPKAPSPPDPEIAPDKSTPPPFQPPRSDTGAPGEGA